MRIALGQIWQETNTLNPVRTTRQDFEAFGVSRGEEMLRTMATTNELGGFIQSLRKWPENPQLVGLVRTRDQAVRFVRDWESRELSGPVS